MRVICLAELCFLCEVEGPGGERGLNMKTADEIMDDFQSSVAGEVGMERPW